MSSIETFLVLEGNGSELETNVCIPHMDVLSEYEIGVKSFHIYPENEEDNDADWQKRKTVKPRPLMIGCNLIELSSYGKLEMGVPIGMGILDIVFPNENKAFPLFHKFKHNILSLPKIKIKLSDVGGHDYDVRGNWFLFLVIRRC